ncbi:MAG: PilN domain-containing protein [Wenzhouxiangellaceae bacterium]|nr:PilN domain-containing protein [Wenzhouxiangellaceae bacterium]MBS3747426.1 PilN domain-containing protein [Wenzhouxiangellaceae bacterium]MBS3824310.1 PilN domain-containing protein [Wenzhouxiangellaceae bacterium]
MQQLAENLRERVRQRYRATPIPAFLSWWGSELGALVPENLSRRLMPPKPQLWLVPAESGGGDFRIWRADGEPRVLDVFGAGEDPKLLQSRWRDILAEFGDGSPEVRLCLHEDQVLALPLELPAAVESNLDQALRFQLDQVSPFRAEQVVLDHRIERHDQAHNRIEVTLRIVPNEVLEPLLARARAFGAVVHAVDTLAGEEPPRPEGFNLLPESRRPRYVHARARFNMLLGVGLVVALGLVMAQTVVLRERTLAGLQAQADELRVEARRVMQLQQDFEETLMAANFLAEKRASQPAAIELLDEVSRRLPDDMWLQQFQLQGRDLRIQGQADGSQRIIGLLDESEMFDSPEITGAISIDPRTGQERFRSQVRVVAGAEPDSPAAEGADS